jgi:hypothetical protein
MPCLLNLRDICSQDNFCVKAGNRVRLVSPDLDTSSNADGGTQGPPSPKPPSAADGQHAPPTAAVADQPVSPAGSPQQPGTVRLQSQKSDGGAYQQLVITYDGLHRLVQVGDNLYLVGVVSTACVLLQAVLPISLIYLYGTDACTCLARWGIQELRTYSTCCLLMLLSQELSSTWLCTCTYCQLYCLLAAYVYCCRAGTWRQVPLMRGHSSSKWKRCERGRG